MTITIWLIYFILVKTNTLDKNESGFFSFMTIVTVILDYFIIMDLISKL